MSKLGKELLSAIREAKEKGLITIKPAPKIADIRKKLKLSQKKFSEIYHINLETLKKWEQNTRIPDSISRAYLKCIEKDPKTIERIINS